MLKLRFGKFSLTLALPWRFGSVQRAWLVIAALAGVAVFAAAITKPHTFTDGDTLSAAKLNENFDTLYAKVNELEAWKTTEEAKGKSWRLIYETDVTSATTSFNVAGLNGNADLQYSIIFRFVGAGTGCTVMIRPNGDSGTSYGYQRVTGTNATPSATRDTAFTGLPLATAQNPGEIASGVATFWAKSGYIRTLTSMATEGAAATTITNSNLLASSWNNTGSNITSMSIASGTNCIGADSHIEIWARR